MNRLKRIAISFVGLLTIGGMLTPASASESCLVGEVTQFVGNYAPINWLPADGKLLRVDQFAALYTVVSCTYGGDCRTSFALPDLNEGKSMVELAIEGKPGYIVCAVGEYPRRP